MKMNEERVKERAPRNWIESLKDILVIARFIELVWKAYEYKKFIVSIIVQFVWIVSFVWMIFSEMVKLLFYYFT